MFRFLYLCPSLTPALLVLLLPLGPARAGEPTVRVAVLPFTQMAASPADCQRLRGSLSGTINSLFEVRMAEQKIVDAAVRRMCGKRPAWWDCLGKDENLLVLGKRLESKTVVVGQLAAVGKRRVLKLRLADVAAGRVSAEVVNVPLGHEEAVLSRFVLLHKEWFGGQRTPPAEPQAPAPPPARAWYQKWELWTLVGTGAVIVAGAVLLATMYTPGETGGPWDFHKMLP